MNIFSFCAKFILIELTHTRHNHIKIFIFILYFRLLLRFVLLILLNVAASFEILFKVPQKKVFLLMWLPGKEEPELQRRCHLYKFG